MNSPMPCREVPTSKAPGSAQSLLQGGWVLAATILGSGMEFIDGTVVNVALPSLQTSLRASGSQVQWTVEAYALFLCSLLLTGGSLGDRFGLRRIFLAGVAIFACASLWCGLASGIGQLLVARCLQGVGGAMLVPNSLALLSANFDGTARGRAIGAWSGFAAIMAALGPVLGGWMVEQGSWRWVFFLNAPVALATVWITLSKIPDDAVRSEQKALDLKGALLATVGLSCVTFSLLEWANGGAVTRLAGVIGPILLVMFVMAERNGKSPMIPLELFRNRNFAGANILTFFLYGSLSATLFYLPLNLIQVQGYSPAKAGAAMLPLAVLLFVLSPWAGTLIERRGARLPLIVGPLLAAGGYGLLALPDIGGSYWTTYFPAAIALGLGMTISVAPLTTLVMNSAQGRNAGVASGVNNAVSQTAALLALALSAPFFFAMFGSQLTEKLRVANVAPHVAAEIQGQRQSLGGHSNPRSARAGCCRSGICGRVPPHRAAGRCFRGSGGSDSCDYYSRSVRTAGWRVNQFVFSNSRSMRRSGISHVSAMTT